MILPAEHPRLHYQFCPRCGQSGTFNDESLSFSCSSCGFMFFLNAAAAVTGLIFDEQQRLLFVRRAVEPDYGKLDLPGGFVDPGENAEDAIIRELKEELGVSPEKIVYYGSFPNEYRFSGTVVYTVDLVFSCQVDDLTNVHCHDDVMGFEFYRPEEVNPEEIPFQSVRNIIRRLIHERKH